MKAMRDRAARWSVSKTPTFIFLKTHLRKSELEAIAKAIGAELITLPRGQREHAHQHDGGKQRRGG